MFSGGLCCVVLTQQHVAYVQGFYYMKMNNPSSAAFTDPSDGGTCGITQVVSIWVDDSA